MKRILLLAAICAAMLSCRPSADNPTNPNIPDGPTKAFTFHLKGAFNVAYEDMAYAPVRLENDNTAGITDIWVLDYSEDGTLLQQAHQISTDADFGIVSMALTYGHHDVKFIASKGTEPNLTASGITWSKVADTFCLDYPVDVAASSNGNRAPELKRCISGVTIENSDAIPANAKQMEVTIVERYSTLTLPGLVGSNAQTYTNVFPYTSADVGKTAIKMTTYSLCPSDEFTVDVTVRVVGTDNSTISEFTVEDVELKVNRKTVLKGECFNRSNGFSVLLDSDWDEPSNILF